VASDPQDRLVRQTFLRVFTRDRQDGALVLAIFAEWCGMNTTDPAIIKPELVALYYRLMLMLGIRGGQGLDLGSPSDYQRFIAEARAMLDIANDAPDQEEAPDAGSTEDG
jgi:hypothetical protein